MDKSILSNLACTYDRSFAYIYIWFSKTWKIVYVGQTNGHKGTLGRAFEHVSEGGTLRKRFEEKTGLSLEASKDLYLLSYPLPQKKEYISIESSYRLAIEYYVQINLRKYRGSMDPIFDVISKVVYTDVGSNFSVQNIANDITKKFIATYTNI
jgi:hypothetical protein